MITFKLLLESIKRFLAPPLFPDDEARTRQAYLLNIILWGLIFVALASIPLTPAEASFGLVANIILLILLKFRYVRTASVIQVFLFWMLFAYLAFGSSEATGTSGPAYMLGFGIVIIISGVLLGGWGAVILTILSLLTGAFIYYAETSGLKTFSPPGNSTETFPFSVVLFPMSALLQNLAARVTQQALQRARNSEKELAQKNQQLQSFSQNLEKLVAERTAELANRTEELTTRSDEVEKANQQISRRAAQLQALAKVSSSIARINNLELLLPEITKVISQQFNYYHAGIFLADEANQYAVLAAANSEGGQRMLNRGHRLRIGQVGIVGNVVGSGLPRIALDTGADAVFFQNLDLPDTHSEMALPLYAGKVIIGALDVQSTEPGAFTEEDIEVLTTLADQVSIAIQNARQYESTQRALAEAEAIYRQSLRADWKRLGDDKKRVTGYRYTLLGTQEVAETVQTEEVQEALAKGDRQMRVDADASALAVPIKLRGEIIGVLNVRAPGGHAWNENELDVVQAVADRVAISAENARLFEETTSRAERERAVADITNKIRATNDPQEMIDTALAELKRALNVNRIQIVPYSAPNKTE